MNVDVPTELHNGDELVENDQKKRQFSDLKVSSVMYVGIDVTHPGVLPGKSGFVDNLDISLAAIVGSWDFGATR